MTKNAFTSLRLCLVLIAAFQMPALAARTANIPVEIVEIKDLGLSDRDESRSVIEVRWRVGEGLAEKVVSFDLVLSITYADGTTMRANRRIGRDATSARLEVPSVRSIGGRTPAFIKKMEARVAAVISKN